VYYNYSPYQDGALMNPELNATGSLYYWAYPNYIDIIDVQHGLPALRFELTETVSNTVSPMAIDQSGQRVFLITNKGLTVIDLGIEPLAIGHLSQTVVGGGSEVTIRGSGFENGMSATVGGVQASISVTDSETLTLTIPGATSGLQDLVLTNPDQTTYTMQSAFTVQ
jgi:IPT/TIG domain